MASKEVVSRLQVEVFGRGDPEVAQSAVGEVGEFGEDAHQPVGVGVGELAQEHRVDHAEDGGGGADSERQAEHGRGGEAGIPGQHAQAVAEILRE